MKTTSTKPEGPPIWLLIALTAINSVALNMFVPAMPLAADEFGASNDTLQLTLTLYLVGVGTAQLFYGPLSDRFGRRPLILGGTALFALASLACALATSPSLLILARLAQAVGGCAGLVLTRAIVRDIWDADKAVPVLGKIMSVMAVAPALSPGIGGWIGGEFGWRTIFLVTAALAGAVSIWAAFVLAETNRERLSLPRLTSVLVNYKTILIDPVFFGLTISTSLISACWFAYLAAGPFMMQTLMQRPAQEFGFVFAAMAISYLTGTVTTSRLSGRIGRIKFMAAGLVFTFLGAFLMLGLALAGHDGFFPVTGSMLLITFGHGLNSPGAITTAIGVKPEMRGTSSGLFGAIQMAASALSTLVIAAIGFSPLSLASMLAATTTMSLIIFLPGAVYMRRRSRLGLRRPN